MKKPILCIYHAGCTDGFASAMAVIQKYGEDQVELYPATYGDAPPDCHGFEKVYIVDFSYPQSELEALCQEADHIYVLDHHKTAIEKLNEDHHYDNLHLHLNNEMSGASLTWTLLHGGAPELIKYVEDYDLWKFEKSETREIIAAMKSYDHEVHIWNHFFNHPISHARAIRELANAGFHIRRAQTKQMREIAANARLETLLGYIDVPIVNCPHDLASGTLEILYKESHRDAPFVASYFDNDTHRTFSLRSNKHNPNAVDVAELAQRMGGGGHKNAAGFRVALGVNHSH